MNSPASPLGRSTTVAVERASIRRDFKNSARDLVLPICVGSIGALLGLVYYFCLNGALKLIWSQALQLDIVNLSWQADFQWKILAVTTIGGTLVGVATQCMGQAGEIAAVVDNIHLENGRIDAKQTPSMVVVSLISIVSGGSAGPEAPLVQILGSLGSWMGDLAKLTGRQVRILTFSGMSAALGAFFGAPIGGALFALEIPHRRGIEYFEALVPALASSLVAFMIFKFALGFEGPLLHLPELSELSRVMIPMAIGLGVLGALLAYVFTAIFKWTHHLMDWIRQPILRGMCGGAWIGLVAMISPKTLFWGEFQINGLLATFEEFVMHAGTSDAVRVFAMLLVLKMFTVGFTLHSGFRGGFIFPLFFIGAVAGILVHVLVPAIPLTLAVLCLMASLNIAITKTLFSTVIILATITGLSAMPLVMTAGFVCFVLTQPLWFIGSQRERAF